MDATPELDPAEVLGVRIPACITRVYAEAPTFSSFATAFTIGKSPLRQACHDFQQLADDGAESGAMSADLVTIATRAFRLACDNKTSKLCEPALEGLKLLCATGMIAGSTKAWAPKPKDASPDENDKEDTDKDDASKTDEEQKKEDELVSLVTAVAKCGEVSSSSTHVACVACISSMAESKSFSASRRIPRDGGADAAAPLRRGAERRRSGRGEGGAGAGHQRGVRARGAVLFFTRRRIRRSE